MNNRVLVTSNDIGGLIRFRKEVLDALAKNNEVYVSCPGGEFTGQIKKLGCKFIPHEFNRRGTNPIADFKLLLDYIVAINFLKPDVVLTYTIKPNVYGGLACQLTRTPYIANVTGLGTAVENGGVMQLLTSLLYKVGLRKAKKVFFQNRANLEFMINKHIIKNNYELIPGSGVNINNYVLLDYPLHETVDFVFISRIMKEKGIVQYLNAAKYIRSKYPFTRFHVCGGCEQDYEGILEKYENKGIIIYHGRVDDISAIHKISSCTIHPTYYPEGMSNVLLESCACGRPIITTDRPGCGEIVDDGVNGFVVKQRDSKDLIEKIEKFLSLSWEERRQMGLNGRAKVEKEFDRQIVVDAYLKEIESI